MLDKTVSGVPFSKEQFKSPPSELGILPFWFWNGELDYDELEYQIKELKAKGLPGFFIHSRFGLSVEYLSDEWFKRVKFVIEKARELNMQVWVYDEKNWPSGTVGWEIPTEFPDLQQRYLELVILDFEGPFFTYLEGTDSRYVDLEDSEPICAYAVRKEEFESGLIKEIIDVTPNLSFDKIIPWEAPAGHWKLLYFVERRARWYIDALNPESTKKFLEKTHEQYKKWVGKDFGELVPGFYTDEPAMHYFEVAKDNFIIPWSKSMFKIFREANGYDLRPHLPALFATVGDETTKVRYDFWSTLNKQYAKAYYQQIANWCEENNLLHTGHLLFEEWLRLQARVEGNLFNLLKELHIIGVDHLYPRIGTEDRTDEHVALKMGSSAAHHFGSTRTLCESLGGTYWDCTMERMKWIADWEYVLGVNLFNPHGFHYSLEGERKRDWPPSQFYHHPWWKQYDKFNDYIARNSYLLSGGRHVAKVAMLYPMTSMWANYIPQQQTKFSKLIEQEFNYLTDALLRVHFDYDYLDEDVLVGGQLQDGKLCVNGEEFAVIILPPLTTIKPETLDKLEEFVKDGGHIIADTVLPTETPTGFDQDVANRIKKLFDVDPIVVRERFSQETQELKVHTQDHPSGGKGIFVEGSGFAAHNSRELLASLLKDCITPDVEISDPQIFYLHRLKDGKDIYFVVNPTADERSFTISLEGEGHPEYLSSETGDTKSINVYQVEKGRTVFDYQLAQYGSALFVLNKDEQKVHVTDTNLVVDEITDGTIKAYGRLSEPDQLQVTDGKKTRQIEVPAKQPSEPLSLDDEWDFSIDTDNVYLVRTFNVTVDEDNLGESKGYHKPELDDSEWMKFIQGAWEMQLPFERDEQTYPVTLWYRTSFYADYVPDDLRLLIDGIKGKSTIYINGNKADGQRRRCKFDAEIKELDIAHLTTVGENKVAIRLEVFDKVAGILDPLKLVGTFTVAEQAEHEVIAKPITTLTKGSWTEQGFPYFSGTGTYTSKIHLPEDYNDQRVFLELEVGDDVVDVTVNGKAVGTILWHPYRLELTEFLQAGENEIAISVTNTLINLFEGKKRPGGLFAAPKLVPYNTYMVNYRE